jgi:hypothetical protein
MLAERVPARVRGVTNCYGSMPSLRSSTTAALRQRIVSGENGSVNGIPFALRSALPSRRTRYLGDVLAQYRDGVLGSYLLDLVRLGVATAAERDLAVRAGVEHPVRGSVAGHQPALAAQLDHVDGGRVRPSGFPPWHGEDLAV